jgi:XRE family transcriptional regulator, regulator of sulfur utilization
MTNRITGSGEAGMARVAVLAIFSVVATLIIVAVQAGAGLGKSSPQPVMHSSVFDWSSFKAEATKTGSRRECFDARTATLDRLAAHITTLNPGEAPHPAHRHPEEEVVIVKEGVLEVVQNDKTSRVEASGMLFMASNELHGLKNVGTKPAVYYVIKWFSPGLSKDGIK